MGPSTFLPCTSKSFPPRRGQNATAKGDSAAVALFKAASPETRQRTDWAEYRLRTELSDQNATLGLTRLLSSFSGCRVECGRNDKDNIIATAETRQLPNASSCLYFPGSWNYGVL